MSEPPHRRRQVLAARTARSLLYAGVLIGAPPSPVVAQLNPTTQITGYVTLGTDARSRGLSQIYDGSAATEIGVDLGFPSRFFTGAAISNVSYPSTTQFAQPRERLIKLYAGYDWVRANWNLGAWLGHYRYPDTVVDYDYSELTFVVGYKNRLFYDVSVTDDFLSLSGTAVNHAIGFTWPFAGNIELSATLGRFEWRGPESSYTHYNVGITKLLGPFSLDLRHYDTSREIVGRIGSSLADNWVLSLSYAISLRD